MLTQTGRYLLVDQLLIQRFFCQYSRVLREVTKTAQTATSNISMILNNP